MVAEYTRPRVRTVRRQGGCAERVQDAADAEQERRGDPGTGTGTGTGDELSAGEQGQPARTM